MTDIVERLRIENSLIGSYGPPSIQIDAADEIERLRAALDRAADALHDTGAYEAWMQARVALDKEEEKRG